MFNTKIRHKQVEFRIEIIYSTVQLLVLMGELGVDMQKSSSRV
jgi:hypothetical protein